MCRTMIRFPIVPVLAAVLAMAGCVDQSKVEHTRAELAQWTQEFRLYHGLNQEPASSLEAVRLDVRKAVQASLPRTERSDLSQDQKERILADAWGTELRFSYAKDAEALVVTVVSAGPDRRFDTADDMRDSIKLDHPGKGTHTK